MRRGLAGLLIAACALLTSCKDEEPGTQVMVVIDAEPSVRERVFDVSLVVKSGDGDVSTWQPRFEMKLTQGSGKVKWPLEVALVPQGGDARRTYLVTATAHGASGGILAEVRAISGYVPGKSLSLPLVFDAACLARKDRCDETQTCQAGHCMDPYVEPSQLLPFQPGYRPGDDAQQAGGGAMSGESGMTGESGSGGITGGDGDGDGDGDASILSGGDGGGSATDLCPDQTQPPCDPEPIECPEDRCAGCPENFLRVDDDTCTPLLVALGLSKGGLSPALNTRDVRYDIAVPLLTDALTLAPDVPEGVTIEVNGEPLAAGSSYTARDLPLGETTLLITLRADGSDSRTYTLKLSRNGGQRTFIKASNAGAGDMFGHAVAMQGDTIVIGAPLEDSSSKDVSADNNLRKDSGAAYVMVREGATYRQAAYLKASTILENAQLGIAVAIDGDTIAVGAPYGEDGGSVFVYRNIDGEWTFEARLTIATPKDDRNFGAAVAVQGDTIAVGSPADDSYGLDSGTIYLFTRDGTSWTRGPSMAPKVPQPAAWLGSSVALHGGRVYSGASGASADISPRGAVYVFASDGEGGYVEEQMIYEEEIGEWDFFGDALVVSDDVLAIAAFGASGSASGNGFIYLYTPGDDGWERVQRIGATNPSTDAHFGLRMALLGDVIITGAPDDDSGAPGINGNLSAESRVDSGAGYVLTRGDSSWQQLAMIKAEPPEAGDQYAYSVAAEGDTLVFGAPGESSTATGVDGDAEVNGAAKSGAVYVVR